MHVATETTSFEIDLASVATACSCVRARRHAEDCNKNVRESFILDFFYKLVESATYPAIVVISSSEAMSHAYVRCNMAISEFFLKLAIDTISFSQPCAAVYSEWKTCLPSAYSYTHTCDQARQTPECFNANQAQLGHSSHAGEDPRLTFNRISVV